MNFKEPRDVHDVLLAPGDLVVGTSLLDPVVVGMKGEVVGLVRKNVIEVKTLDGIVHRCAAFLWKKETLDA